MNFNEDFSILLSSDGVPKKVYRVFNKYKPLISKKANLYQACSKGKILAEDFISEVYLELYYFIERLRVDRVVDPAKFSFYISVANAIKRVFDKKIKIIKNECRIQINEEDGSEVEFRSRIVFSELFSDIQKFYDSLSERQLFVVKKKEFGYTQDEIQKMLGVSHGTVVRDLMLAKEKYEYFFKN